MGVWLSDKTPLEVELLVDKEIGTYALNRIWHSEQTVEERDDGSIYVKFQTTKGPEAITSKFAQMADYQKKNLNQDESQLEMLRKILRQHSGGRFVVFHGRIEFVQNERQIGMPRQVIEIA